MTLAAFAPLCIVSAADSVSHSETAASAFITDSLSITRTMHSLVLAEIGNLDIPDTKPQCKTTRAIAYSEWKIAVLTSGYCKDRVGALHDGLSGYITASARVRG